MEKSVESFRFALYLEFARAKESKAEFIRAVEESYGSDAICEAHHIFDEWIAARDAGAKYDYNNYLSSWQVRQATLQPRMTHIDVLRHSTSILGRAARTVRLTPVLGTLLLLGAAAWWFTSCEETRRNAAKDAVRQSALEAERIGHADPMMRLAGCMANRASNVAKMTVARIIYEADYMKNASDEAVTSYKDVYGVLLEECAPKYLAEAQASRPGLSQRDISLAFLSTMKADAEVAYWIQLHLDASKAAKRVYVK